MMWEHERERLLFRRQFILGPREVTTLPTWKAVRLGDGWYVTAHPDLAVTQRRERAMTLTLLGFMLDPEHPDADNDAVVKRLLERTGCLDDLFQVTSPMGGRWILVADDGQRTMLFTDPAGLRPVVYTVATDDEAWCASQPEILRRVTELEIDPEAQGFMKSAYYTGRGQAWWPGAATPYRNVRHLLPNHVLDVRTHEVRRFWPQQPRKTFSLEEGVERGSVLMRGLMQSASRRSPLALALTAGCDSRTVLAAMRDFRDDVYYFTYLWRQGMEPTDTDVVVPARLLDGLGLTHHLLDAREPDNGRWVPAEDKLDYEAFKLIYRQNVTGAHEVWAPLAYTLYRSGMEDRICVKGHSGEIVRCGYRAYGYPEHKLDGEALARKVSMGKTPFAIRRLSAWLDEARAPAEATGYRIFDLLYWEQRAGRWQASDQLEQDIVQETFTPFNCRALLETFLAVDERYRFPTNPRLFLSIMQRLWPEVLHVPVVKSSFNWQRRMYERFRAVLVRTETMKMARTVRDALRGIA